MANDEMPNETITLSDPDIFNGDAFFYMKQDFSDITLIVNGERIPAHKVILATRSSYFHSLLHNNLKQSEIVVKGKTSVGAFKKLLKYIYSGSLTAKLSEMDLVFDVIQLANKFSLKNLEVAISEKIASVIKMETIFDIVNKANEYEMEDLIRICHKFMNENSLEILQNQSFNGLTQKSVVKLLERNSFLAPEIKIFESVAKWCQYNKDHNNLVIQCVRLSSLTNEEILSTVYPTRLVEDHKLLAIMAQTVKEKPRSLNLEPVPLMDENLACSKYGAEVLTGANPSYLLNGNRNVYSCAYHYIGDKSGVTIKLKTHYYVNNIHMQLWDAAVSCYYGYYVQVSLDGKIWQTILDYSQYHCRSYQNLHFDKVLVQYIRVVGTYKSVNDKEFRLVFLETYFTTNSSETSGGIVRPRENVATLELGAIVFSGINGNNLLQNNIDSFTRCHNIPIIIQLAQPYRISNIKFLLPRSKGCTYKYQVETSMDSSCWEMAVECENHWYSDWQNNHFEERAVIYIKISGSRSGNCHGHRKITNILDCACFQCFSGDTEKVHH